MNKIKKYLIAVFYYLLFSFLFFGMWEWLQTPFFKDLSRDINMIVFFRFHCTLMDILILTGCIVIYSIIKRSIYWLKDIKKLDYIIITIFGISYTLFSEYLNVHIRESWSYSSIMIIIPFIKIGIIPLLQWIILPAIIIKVTKDHLKEMV